MNFTDPYQAYVEGSVFSSHPVRLIVALYEGAIAAVRQARQCLSERDVIGRSKSVTKAFKIVTELLVSLDHKQGGEISVNLKRLYSYMQCRLLEANHQQKETPLSEVEKLLTELLEGWQVVAGKTAAEQETPFGEKTEETRVEYSTDYGMFEEPVLAGSGVCAVF